MFSPLNPFSFWVLHGSEYAITNALLLAKMMKDERYNQILVQFLEKYPLNQELKRKLEIWDESLLKHLDKILKL